MEELKTPEVSAIRDKFLPPGFKTGSKGGKDVKSHQKSHPFTEIGVTFLGAFVFAKVLRALAN